MTTQVLSLNGECYLVDPAHNEMRAVSNPLQRMSLPRLKPQEIAFDDPRSSCRFRSNGTKPFLTTPGARELYGDVIVCGCLSILQALAIEHDGIDYLQVFIDDKKPEPLWFIEDGEGGAITALLPSEY